MFKFLRRVAEALGTFFLTLREYSRRLLKEKSGADTEGVDRVDIHPPFFSKKKFEMSLYLK